MTARPHTLDFVSRRTQTKWRETAIAASHYTAVATAAAVLREGGHAVDAALAGVFTTCVCEPQSTSLGADLCAMVFEPGRPVAALNATGPAPRAMTLDALARRGITDKWPDGGAETVTVPGLVRGAEALWRKFGRVRWERLWADALRWSESGIPVTDHVAADWLRAVRRLASDPDSSAQWLDGGKAPRAGTAWAPEGLHRTIKTISRGGADAFYTGPIAAEIARSVQAKGGFIHEEDLAEYRPRWVEPLRGAYRGITILEMPPNSQGAVVLEALNILSGLEAPAYVADRMHLQIEALKMAFDDGFAAIADPETESVDVSRLVDPAFAARRRDAIDLTKAGIVGHGPTSAGHNTAYIAVVDRDGNGASIIHSSKEGFGSGVTAGSTGVMLQRRADGFRLRAGHINAVKPGKRPYHTILPSIALRGGELWSVFGTTGGIGQPQNQVQVLQSLIDDGLAPQEAVDRPRFSVREDFSVVLEPRTGTNIAKALEVRGHRIARTDWITMFGGAHVILRENGWYLPASDPRRDGASWGS